MSLKMHLSKGQRHDHVAREVGALRQHRADLCGREPPRHMAGVVAPLLDTGQAPATVTTWLTAGRDAPADVEPDDEDGDGDSETRDEVADAFA